MRITLEDNTEAGTPILTTRTVAITESKEPEELLTRIAKAMLKELQAAIAENDKYKL